MKTIGKIWVGDQLAALLTDDDDKPFIAQPPFDLYLWVDRHGVCPPSGPSRHARIVMDANEQLKALGHAPRLEIIDRRYFESRLQERIDGVDYRP